MKIGCVIQGDIRRGTDHLIRELPRYFDFTVLSTWIEDEHRAPPGDYTLVINNKPLVSGVTNRNFQRFSTSRGIQAAKDAGCDYVLKWRTDMLPTRIDVYDLLRWANYRVPSGMTSRIVMPAYRNLSVEPDWFSSIPDLFAFGHIDAMEALWGDDDFDFSLNINVPRAMSDDLAGVYSNLPDLYCAESECYAILRARIQAKLGVKLSHPEIAYNYLRLIDHQRLGIYWFGRTAGFRSIAQGWEHPWWTEAGWINKDAKIVPLNYPVLGAAARIRRQLSPIRALLDQYRQLVSWSLR